MVIATQIKEHLAAFDYGTIFTINDFDIESRYQATLVRALNRKVATGELQKVSKGKYYKPQKTVFGSLSPTPYEIVKDLLEKKWQNCGLHHRYVSICFYGTDYTNHICYHDWYESISSPNNKREY